MKRIWLVILPTVLLLALFPVSADEPAKPYVELEELIPEDLTEYFPELEKDISSEYLEELDGEFFLGYIFSSLKEYLDEALALLFQIISIALLTSLMQGLFSGLGSSHLSECALYLPCICMALTVFQVLFQRFTELEEALYRVSSGVQGLSAAMGGVFLMAGSPSSAGTSAAQTLLLMNVINLVTKEILMPVLRICFVLECVSVLSKKPQISSVSSFSRHSFVFLTSALMTVLGAVFTYQCSVSASADSWLVRTARFAAGSIPVVGSAISEASRTLFGSFEIIKAVSGGVGIAVILLAIIPPMAQLALLRWCVMLAGAFCEGIGCSGLSPILKGAGELMGFALAIASVLSVGAIFCITLLIKMGGVA